MASKTDCERRVLLKLYVSVQMVDEFKFGSLTDLGSHSHINYYGCDLGQDYNISS